MAQNSTALDKSLNGDAFASMLIDALKSCYSLFAGPTSPENITPEIDFVDGTMWWDTSSSPWILKVWDGTDWIDLATSDGTPTEDFQDLLDDKLSLTGGNRTALEQFTMDDEPSDSMEVATKGYVDENLLPPTVVFMVQGSLTVTDNYAGRLLDRSGYLTNIRARVLTAPVGSGLTVRISRLPGELTSPPDGTDVVDATRTATIASGSKYINESVTALELNAGDVLRLDVTSVGSTTPGGNDLYVICTISKTAGE